MDLPVFGHLAEDLVDFRLMFVHPAHHSAGEHYGFPVGFRFPQEGIEFFDLLGAA
jgi:hypothetical protein